MSRSARIRLRFSRKLLDVEQGSNRGILDCEPATEPTNFAILAERVRPVHADRNEPAASGRIAAATSSLQ
jgi:hypothetical protein